MAGKEKQKEMFWLVCGKESRTDADYKETLLILCDYFSTSSWDITKSSDRFVITESNVVKWHQIIVEIDGSKQPEIGITAATFIVPKFEVKQATRITDDLSVFK